ncbi:hypothetical protein [Aeromonas hydrophila]|uniref:hypothetical protein n=1 Tax=Aeromonas hydrophila TaxID=644 RepID=UPI00244282E8|nr:hypothetical protein [Aeromonas hydrophila]
MQPKPVAIIVSAIMKASRTSELLATLDAYYNPFQTGNTPVAFGVKKVPGRSIERERKEANSEALAVLARAGGDPSRLTEADRAALRKYTGEGGIGGSQDEYYTPQYVAEGVWDAMAAMGMGPGNYVEPSCGVGVFNGTKPAGVIITGAELSDTSSQINQLLHPEDTIHTGAFETLAVTTEDGTWDGAVGNVPFASNRAGLADKDPEYRDIKYVDQYFITRTLDKLRGGALLCMVVPPAHHLPGCLEEMARATIPQSGVSGGPPLALLHVRRERHRHRYRCAGYAKAPGRTGRLDRRPQDCRPQSSQCNLGHLDKRKVV